MVLLAGCGSPQSTGPRLRITNTSSFPLDRVVVMFPNEQVTFGPIPTGETSDYQPIEHGVYGYAAYQVTFDGQTITQPVLDWMGATPLDGESFTNVLVVDPQQPQWSMVQSEVRQE